MNAHVRSTDIADADISSLTAIAIGNVNPFDNRVFVAKPGRPPGADPRSERTLKPWLSQGISQRTYYRRKAATRASGPHQQSAHVVAWYEAAGPIARLEYRAMMRRCLLGSRQPVTYHGEDRS